MQAEVAEKFTSTFQLTPLEIASIEQTTDDHLHPDFFKSLERAKAIYANCKVLLRMKDQMAGLEIMENMSAYLELAYERLFR